MDLDSQNMLFVVGEGSNGASRLSGIVDCEYAQTALRYSTYEYPPLSERMYMKRENGP